MITDIDQAADVLGADLRSIWRQVADILPQNGGHRLVGGTALAVHLRHRQSFDLDFLSTRPFDGHLLAQRLGQIPGAEIVAARDDWTDVRVGAANVQVFRQGIGATGTAPRWLAPSSTVSGIEVASIQDLLASKLDVVLRRAANRDYYDLVSIDTMTGYSLEQGLDFHRRRYGATPDQTDQIIARLEHPSLLPQDRRQQLEMQPVLRHLQTRIPALRRESDLYRRIMGTPSPSAPFRQAKSKQRKPAPMQAPAASVCSVWMPRAKKRCALAAGHAGPHRSQR